MDREKILAYSERTENLGEPEVFLGTGEVKEPGCGDQLNMYINTKRELSQSSTILLQILHVLR